MELDISHEQGYILASTAGAIDDSATEPFAEHLRPLVGRPGARVVIDLSGSNLITSRGLGQLVALVAHANMNGSRIVLAAPSLFVAAVFERSRLTTYFQIVDSVAEAAGRVSGK